MGRNDDAVSRNTQKNSRRCGYCAGCRSEPCGNCVYCSDNMYARRQICVHKRCHTLLTRKLMSMRDRYKKPCQQCSSCLDKRGRDCGTCLMCMDKLHFDGEHLPGSLCLRRKCKQPIWNKLLSSGGEYQCDNDEEEQDNNDRYSPATSSNNKRNFKPHAYSSDSDRSECERGRRRPQKTANLSSSRPSKYQLNLKSQKTLIKYRRTSSVHGSSRVTKGRVDRLKAKYKRGRQNDKKRSVAKKSPENEDEVEITNEVKSSLTTEQHQQHSPTKTAVMDDRKFLNSFKRPTNGVEKVFRNILDRNSKNGTEIDAVAELDVDDILDRLLRRYAVDSTISSSDVLDLFYSLPCADLVNGLPLDKLDSLSKIKNDPYVIKPLSVEPVTAVEQSTQNSSSISRLDSDPVILGYIISLDKDQLASMLTGSVPKSLSTSGSVPNLHYVSTNSNNYGDQRPNSSSLNFNSSLIASQLQRAAPAPPPPQSSTTVLHQSFSSENMQLQLKLLQMHQQHHNYAASERKT